jgi:D-alanyl-D-alanine dipeptidase
MSEQKYKNFNLVEITESSHNVILDIRYATENNFTDKKVYQNGKCFLHKEAEDKLLKSIEIADKLGYKIKIFDAFRPSEAQYKLWEHTPDDNFLANPERGSPHSRGVAIDMNLVDKNNLEELDMGTGFDDFTKLSFHNSLEHKAEIISNRMKLLGIMSCAGWDFYQNEWWHYQLFDAKKYPLISDSDAETNIM